MYNSRSKALHFNGLAILPLQIQDTALKLLQVFIWILDHILLKETFSQECYSLAKCSSSSRAQVRVHVLLDSSYSRNCCIEIWQCIAFCLLETQILPPLLSFHNYFTEDHQNKYGYLQRVGCLHSKAGQSRHYYFNENSFLCLKSCIIIT